MNVRTQRVYFVLTLMTLGVMTISILEPTLVAEMQLLIAGSLIAIVGIPHGATDYTIFKNLVNQHYSDHKQKRVNFFTYYTSLLIGYTLVWIFLPIAAFVIFIALSLYHFGQSNWNYLKTNNIFIKSITYLVWGAFVIFVPISIYIDEATAIIQNMTNTTGININYAFFTAFPRNLLIVNIWSLFFLFSKNFISKQDFFKELFLLVLLFSLYYTTPLLLGFSIYFALWHSYGSVLDQIHFIKTSTHPNYNIKKYYLEALPMILLSFFGMGAMWFINFLGIIEFSVVGLFFIMIAIVTLPHMVLIERLYEKLSHEENTIMNSILSKA